MPAPQLLGAVAAALGLKPAQVLSAQLLDNGTAWLGLLLDSPQTVQQLRPDFARLKGAGHKVGVAAMHAGASATAAMRRIWRCGASHRTWASTKTRSPAA